MPTRPESTSHPPRRVLVIEDEPAMRDSLILMLEMEGFTVLATEWGERGVELARAHRPELILCDVMLPRLDGYGVLEELRKDPATTTIPFIFLTAKGEKADQRAGMNRGADDYLVKPVGRDELLAAIVARLKRKQHHNDEVVRQLNQVKFSPDFSSAAPLEALGVSPREAEVLLWLAQGKNNEEIGLILGASRNTIKKHVGQILRKLNLESRNSAMLRAVETLSIPKTSGSAANKTGE